MVNMIKIKIDNIKQFINNLGIKDQSIFTHINIDKDVVMRLSKFKEFFKIAGYVLNYNLDRNRIYVIVNKETIETECEFYADHDWVSHPYFKEYKMCMDCREDNYNKLSDETKEKIRENMGKWGGWHH